jgi:hypothetical protein
MIELFQSLQMVHAWMLSIIPIVMTGGVFLGLLYIAYGIRNTAEEYTQTGKINCIGADSHSVLEEIMRPHAVSSTLFAMLFALGVPLLVFFWGITIPIIFMLLFFGVPAYFKRKKVAFMQKLKGVDEA